MNQAPAIKPERSTDDKCGEARRATGSQTMGLGAYLIVACALVLITIIALWPEQERVPGRVGPGRTADSAAVITEETVPIEEQVRPADTESVGLESKVKAEEEAGRRPRLTYDERTLSLVVLAGALGSLVHAITSFVTFAGNRKLVQSWILWYVMRPFIGAALALVFYFVVRGGLLLLAGSGQVNLSGAVAIAALTGMFSKNATDKLSEVFKTMFKTTEREGDDARKDKLASLTPVAEAMIPAHSITKCTIPPDKGEGDIKINDLLNLVTGVVTRIPVVTKDRTVKYVIHASMLYKHVTEECAQAKRENRSFDSDTLKLEDFVKKEGVKEFIADSLVFVDCEAMLAEAKEKMDKTPNCQDVIVTKTGRRDEPIQGWLTNIDIEKYTEA